MHPFETIDQYNAHQLSTIWTDSLASRYTKDVEYIAKRAHDTNRAHSTFGGCSVNDQMAWEDLPQETRDSVIELTHAHIRSPISSGIDSSKESHDRWMKVLLDNGWKYAPGAKDSVKKTHPCLVEYDRLPDADKAKDHIFQAVVRQGVWELAKRVLTLYRTELGREMV